MFENPANLLTALVFLPAVGALILLLPIFSHKNPDAIRFFALGTSIVTFLLSASMMVGGSDAIFQTGQDQMQVLFSVPWIPSFDINFMMGLDGISFPLVVLTTFITMLSMGASWGITKHVRAFFVLFLLLETGMIGVFMALDFFLFYIFWEVMLLPMYFLIGVWGGPRKEYAAIKFFLYTLLGGVLMLVAILMLYFSSDLSQLK